ncbi:MAG TPA: flagellar export chaperone FlgN [Planctomycetota bacterium]|nr:flagellar export chaperone FlgN [Planctomycetota bacterium]
MSAKIDRLAAVLEEELALTRRLLDLAKDARAAAVSADPTLLAQIVSEQEENAAKLEAIEVDRAAAAREVAAEAGMDVSGRIKLAAIVERLGGEPAARLRRLGGRLRAVALDLREASTRTREILEASLIHIDGFFNVLSRAQNGPGAYGAPRARRGSSSEAALMDRKA